MFNSITLINKLFYIKYALTLIIKPELLEQEDVGIDSQMQSYPLTCFYMCLFCFDKSKIFSKIMKFPFWALSMYKQELL